MAAQLIQATVSSVRSVKRSWYRRKTTQFGVALRGTEPVELHRVQFRFLGQGPYAAMHLCHRAQSQRGFARQK